MWAIVPCSPNMVTVRVCCKLRISSKSVVFTNKVGKNSRYFVDVLNKTIIPLALVGYEMIIARASLAIYHLISNAHSWNNCEILTKWTRQPWLSPFKFWSQSRITLSFRVRCMAWYGWRKFPAKCRTVMFWWCWRLLCVMTWTILATITPTR